MALTVSAERELLRGALASASDEPLDLVRESLERCLLERLDELPMSVSDYTKTIYLTETEQQILKEKCGWVD